MTEHPFDEQAARTATLEVFHVCRLYEPGSHVQRLVCVHCKRGIAGSPTFLAERQRWAAEHGKVVVSICDACAWTVLGNKNVFVREPTEEEMATAETEHHGH